jgi:hypothetical protein
LEIYLKVETKLAQIRDIIMVGGASFAICKEYIQLAPQKDREEFEVCDEGIILILENFEG